MIDAQYATVNRVPPTTYLPHLRMPLTHLTSSTGSVMISKNLIMSTSDNHPKKMYPIQGSTTAKNDFNSSEYLKPSAAASTTTKKSTLMQTRIAIPIKTPFIAPPMPYTNRSVAPSHSALRLYVDILNSL